MSYLRVFFFSGLFCLLLEHLVEVRPGARFQPGEQHRSDQEGSSSVPWRIVQTLWGCLHSSLLKLGVQSGIFIVLPQQFYTAALLHFCSLKSVLFPLCYSIPSCWHPWVHVIQPRRYFQGHLIFFPKLHSSNCKTFLSLLTLWCFYNAEWKQWYKSIFTFQHFLYIAYDGQPAQKPKRWNFPAEKGFLITLNLSEGDWVGGNALF